MEVSYKLSNKPGEILEKEFTVVTRLARQVVKLFNIKDTPIIRDMENVRKMASENLSINGLSSPPSTPVVGGVGDKVEHKVCRDKGINKVNNKTDT